MQIFSCAIRTEFNSALVLRRDNGMDEWLLFREIAELDRLVERLRQQWNLPVQARTKDWLWCIAIVHGITMQFIQFSNIVFDKFCSKFDWLSIGLKGGQKFPKCDGFFG